MSEFPDTVTVSPSPDNDNRRTSNSELTEFRRCRRKWMLSNWRKLEPAVASVGGPLRTGTVIHDVIERYYTGGEGESGRLAASERLKELWLTDSEGWDLPPKDMIETHDMARAVVEGYFEWLEDEGADHDFKVLDAEIPLRAASPVVGVDLVAKLDLLVEKISTGDLLIVDHKSCQDLTTPLKTIHLLSQPKIYHTLLRILQPERRVTGTLFNFLRKSKRTARAKPPFFGRYEIYHTDEELRLYWLQLYGVISEMIEVERRLNNGEDPRIVAYTTPTSDCSWDCQFFHACTLMEDGRSDVEGHLAEFFKVHNPMERYDEAAA